MLADDVAVVSVNDHFIEPPTLWHERVSSRVAAPTFLPATAEHGPAWRIGPETIRLPSFFPFDLARATVTSSRDAEMWAAAADPALRLTAMDSEGVDVHTLFPNAIGFAGERLRWLGNAAAWQLCAEAYNDHLLGDYCRSDRARLVGVAILPLADLAAAAREVDRCGALGARGITLPHNPSSLGLPSYHDGAWDVLFSAVEAAGLPVFIHIATSATVITTGDDAPVGVPLTLANLDGLSAMADLAFSPVLGKFPDVVFVIVEAGVGWVPYLTERIDYFAARQGRSRAAPHVPLSRTLRRQVKVAFIEDGAGLRHCDEIGVDRILWQSDFPHTDSLWPQSRARLTEMLAALPDEDARAIAEVNARLLLRLPSRSTSHRPLSETSAKWTSG